MAKKKEVEYEVEEIIECISEVTNSDWGKFILRSRCGKDKPPMIDIRRIEAAPNVKDVKVGKGISLTDDEADRVVNVLVSLGYGNTENLKQALENRRESYGLGGEES